MTPNRATVTIRVDVSRVNRALRRFAIAFELIGMRGRRGPKREALLVERYQLMHEAACRSERFGPGWCE